MILRAYRVLLHLYPRRFRREYGDDMVLLLEDQLRDEGTARVLGRAVLDLALTVPTRHLEVHVKHSSAVLTVLLTAAGLTFAVVGGPYGLVAAGVAVALAVVTLRRSRPVVASGATWWKLLAAGAGLLVAEIIVTTMTGELPDGGWFVAMAVGLTSLVLLAAGVVLGIAGRLRPKAA